MHLLSFLTLASSALATIYTTSPVASTSSTGGQVLNVTWMDNGETPLLTDIGICSVDLCVGSITKQTCIQNLAESVDVSKAESLMTTIDPSVGPDGDFYFIKYTAADFQQNGQDYMQFSARFT